MTDPSLDRIRTALKRGKLPGVAAQVRMAPLHRGETLRDMPKPPGAREGSVCVLLYPGEDGLTLPLTRRTEALANHRGQISFPGGAREPGETPAATALREVREELGVDLSGAELLGALSPVYIPPSHFYVTPFLVFTPQRPVLRPDPREVAEVIEVPLATLLDPAVRREEDWVVRGELRRVPFYRIGNHNVWGATAMILCELAALVEQDA